MLFHSLHSILKESVQHVLVMLHGRGSKITRQNRKRSLL